MDSPQIVGVLETCLYVEDLETTKVFYQDKLGLELIHQETGRHVFFRCGEGVLLFFRAETTREPDPDVPSHGAEGPGHVCLAISPEQITHWKRQLEEQDIALETELSWPNGGHSLYFRDPSGNSIELATPCLWEGDLSANQPRKANS